jgi:acetate kinase
MKILVINSGSSSIKYELFDMRGPQSLATGVVERIGEPQGRIRHLLRGDDSGEQVQDLPIPDHEQGLQRIVDLLAGCRALSDLAELGGIGHRVVHGGQEFRDPTLLSDRVVETIGRLADLAPLHNPANLQGIEVTRRAFPAVPQVAVFDTAFHQTIPPPAHLYAIPYEYFTRLGVRRYGFHGTSHAFVSKAAAAHLGRPLESLRLITLHLGNGASAAAIDRGRCVDTSMGLTPLEGLMMGTRCGDLDPAILPFLAQHESLSLSAVDEMLNEQSGLKGICGANDMREILGRAERGDDRAELALQMYAHRVKKYLGAYLAVLGGADAIVFTAGIGEHASRIRALACAGLQQLGIDLDADKNDAAGAGTRAIQSAASAVQILVVPTDEELEIACQTAACIAAGHAAQDIAEESKRPDS